MEIVYETLRRKDSWKMKTKVLLDYLPCIFDGNRMQISPESTAPLCSTSDG